MKLPLKKYALVSLLLIATLSSSGCYMFKKKNRCGDCPRWSKHG